MITVCRLACGLESTECGGTGIISIGCHFERPAAVRCPVTGIAGEGQSDNENVDFPKYIAIDEHAYSGGFIYNVFKRKFRM